MGQNKKWDHFNQGIKAGVPIALGYIPIAITFGALAKQAALPTYDILVMSAWMYTGAGQFMAVSMFASGVGAMEIIIATGMLTLRHIVMELTFHNRYKKLTFPWRFGLSLGITDESFAVISMKKDKSQEYMAALMFTAYSSWFFGTLIGCISASIIPTWLSRSMEIGLYALFISLLIPALSKKSKLGLITITSMALNWLMSQYINKGWAIIISIILGASLGIWLIGDEEI
ncbi:AzlC family ABC transporter permease [Clostridium sp. YIM B02551]|uniref:AzlC family ABC transporter permease n=1 Tax=Clostridium sp. YIM B02551 TaxID=2910679 RepID=UPI001EEB21BA|nr:AzlC family ABC transporter permease [Clostridium sp. YIM B02551]